MEQALPTGPAKGEKFAKKELDKMVDEYYELRGWDKKTGLHLEGKLKKLGMADVLKDLEKRNLVVSSKATKKAKPKKKR